MSIISLSGDITSGYISVGEFIDSPYYCAFASCCGVSGDALSGTINGLIMSATYLIDNYLGRTLHPRTYKEIFQGRNQVNHFCEIIPVINVSGLVYADISPTYTYYSNEAMTLTGTIDYLYESDLETGLLRKRNTFRKNIEYTLIYRAGYEIIPNDIKEAVKMLVLNLAQRIDTGNMANPDVNIQHFKTDTTSFAFGNGGQIKNVIVRNFNEVNYIPIHIQGILNRYRYNQGSY